ncbi:immunity protein Imm33 domain-containing protein [Herbaspirillum hiltneri]|uniref:immunity protein Imm33 domain-containing protein n=1 Tax=Herbaspirillum hiltneri TaxID=341045 RepID=UPI0009F9D92F|nr:DUF2185 domain-containing protein [Herbaspirillum hiltneri]
MSWLFADPPNMAVISHRRIVEGASPISFVSHDEDDGGWQFFPNSDGALDASEAVVASFKSIVNIDSSIVELADLPLGWCARRTSPTGQWTREKI